MSSQATNTRLQITRSGITTATGATEYLKNATNFAAGAWGFPDGSVLVFRKSARSGDDARTAQQISRRRWAAFNPN